MSTPVDTIRWVGDRPGVVEMIDQTLLPRAHEVLRVETVPAMIDAIRRLAVRGAPAIGVSAAYGLLLGLQHDTPTGTDAFLERMRGVAAELAASRPTAVNLSWALERMKARAESERGDAGTDGGEKLLASLFEEAHTIWREDREICRKLGEVGAELLSDGSTVLTHCNAGSLATAGLGTALAPIYTAAESGKQVAVYADETRPLLQGARLTTWELMQAGIDVTLITDNTAGRVLFERRIDLVLVGADRIARNGDVANKIGTYGVAVLARANAVPFYVVAPLSTFDPDSSDGSQIPIEERDPAEVTVGFGERTAPEGVQVYAPAFDVTPASLVTGIVTEVGLIREPDRERVEDALRRGGRLE